MDYLLALRDKVDDLSLRERLAVFAGVFAVTFLLWDLVFMQPLADREKQYKTRIQQMQSEQFSLNNEISDLVVESEKDPNRENREKLKRLRKELGDIESVVQASTRQLVNPDNMAMILQSVLQETRGLELLHVKGLGAKPVVEMVDKAADEEPVAAQAKAGSIIDNAYKHGLRIEFEGDYLSTLEYIRALENLDWKFFWDSFEFEVIEYPRSKAAINVFTLSLNKDWIGV